MTTTKIEPSRIDQTQGFTFAEVTANTVTVSGGIVANGAVGAKGEILASNGTHTYWSSATAAGLKGDKGEIGTSGTSGTKGDTGAAGDKGDKGDDASALVFSIIFGG